MVFIPFESVVADKTARDCLKKTLRELLSVTCADGVVMAMFNEATASDFILFPDLVENADSVAMLDGPMTKSKYINKEQFLSVLEFTLKFPKSKYDIGAITNSPSPNIILA